MSDVDGLEIRLLGPLEVVVDGARRELRGAGERAVLSLLALDAGHVVSSDRLIDALWGEHLPVNPANALQLRVSKLRRALRDLDVDATCVVTRPPGYLLDIEPTAVDALRFARDVADARRAAEDGSPRAVERYRAALALWRGSPLVEFATEVWAVPEVRRIEELRLAAIEECIAGELDAGRHTGLVDQLEALVAQHPLRERFHEQLMLALYRCGRQADALAAYQRARVVLADELGLEPSAALRDLEAAVLRQDATLAVVEPSVSRQGNLQGRLASFVGRDAELTELASLLGEHRLVTVTGTGGTGKTALALEAARLLHPDAPDGAWFVDLSGVTEVEGVPNAIADALRLPRTDPLPDESPESRLARRLAAHTAFVVLDNCEHLIDACATVAQQLLSTCPGLRILATSREPLAVPGEGQFQLGPLATPPPDATVDQLLSSPAVRLFADRARAATRGFVVDDTTAADIGQLCRQLDGIPLAIELAAARTPALPVAQIVARLDDRFRLLTSGSRTAHARQRTLRATVDWSHELLTQPEKTLLRRLAVFRGGWVPEAAEATCTGDGLAAEDILELTSRLVDRSLVVADPRSGRFRLLETIRRYAAERLAEAGESQALHQAHAAFYEHLAHQAGPHLQTRDQTEWMTRLRDDHDNFRAALAWCRDHPEIGLEVGMRMAGALGWYWYLSDHLEGRRQLRATLHVADRAGDITPAARGRTLQAMAMVERPGACVVHPSPVCAHAARESVALFEAAGEPVAAALSRLLTAVEGAAGDAPGSSLAAIDQAELELREAGHLWGLALAEFIRMEVSMRTPDSAAAIAAGQRAVARFHQVGDRWGVSAVLSHLGANLRQLGRLSEAVDILQESLRIARDVNLWNTVHWVAGDLGLTQLMLDRRDDAERSFDEAQRVATRYGFSAGQGLASLGRGHLARRGGDGAAAREHFRQAISLCEQVGSSLLTATALASLGYLEESLGELERADGAHRQVLALGGATFTAMGMEGLAGVAVARGAAMHAAELLGQAAELRDRHQLRPTPLERPDMQRITRLIRHRLDPEAFDAAFNHGRQTTLDDLRSVP